MVDYINTDIINFIASIVDLDDIIVLASINTIFNYAMKNNVRYQHHVLLVKKDPFDSVIPNYVVLKFHLKKYLILKNYERIFYYAQLCSKYNVEKLLFLLLSKTRCISDIKNIIRYASDMNVINTIRKYVPHINIDYCIIEYSRSYEILNAYINNSFECLCIICDSLNHIGLEIYMNKNYPIRKDIIRRRLFSLHNSKLIWHADNYEFRKLVLLICGEDYDTITHKFMYACEYETIDYFKINKLNISMLSTGNIMTAIYFSFSNLNAYDIIIWWHQEQKIILTEGQILGASIKMANTNGIQKQQLLISYWKSMYSDVIQKYCKENLIELSKNIIYIFYEYIDVNVIFSILFPESASMINFIDNDRGAIITKNMIQYLANNIIFTETTNPIILLFFWYTNNPEIITKFIDSNIPIKNKTNILTKYLALVNTHTDDPHTINNICQTIMSLQTMALSVPITNHEYHIQNQYLEQ